MTRLTLAFLCVLGTVSAAHAGAELGPCQRDADCGRGYTCTKLQGGQAERDGAGFCQASWGDLYARIEVEPGLSASACQAVIDAKTVSCDANGSFIFERIPVGKQVVRITVPGYLARTLSMWVNPGVYNDAGTILVRTSVADEVRPLQPLATPAVLPAANPRLPGGR